MVNELPKLFDVSKINRRSMQPHYTFIDLVTYVSNSIKWLQQNHPNVVRSLEGSMFTVDGLYEQLSHCVPTLADQGYYVVFFEEFRVSSGTFETLPTVTLTIRSAYIDPYTFAVRKLSN